MRKHISNLNIRFHELAIVISTLVLMTACGSTTARDSTTTLGSASTAVATATATPSTGNIYDLPDANSYVAEINGVNGAVPTSTPSFIVQTSRTLKVKVTPLAAPNLTLPGYTNWNFPYGCFRIQVTVNGVTKTTDILKVDGVSQTQTSICANAASYQVLDFSNDVSGNGPSSVVISNANYDNCRYTNPLTYGCSMSAIFQNHIVAATIAVQTDGTYMDQ